jgi:EAL domain-containing protein (putative c-di-GMP-specific phosphodiesterase class I)
MKGLAPVSRNAKPLAITKRAKRKKPYLPTRAAGQNRMQPADLRLEITETALLDAPRLAASVLAELREFGVKIYLDDFGTGYSSLSHLHKLPVDALKIDRSFVQGLFVADGPAIVESILALARTLRTTVVAEGVEDERQATELERLGCRLAQGYYFSRPIPPHEIEELLAAGQPLGGQRTPLRGPLVEAAAGERVVVGDFRLAGVGRR